MRARKKFAMVLALLGIGLIGFSYYISNQVTEGKEKVSHAQKQVDQGASLFSLSPYTKDLGPEITGPVQEKIDEGQQKIYAYEQMAYCFQVAGIALLVIGVGLFAVAFRHNRKKRE